MEQNKLEETIEFNTEDILDKIETSNLDETKIFNPEDLIKKN